MILQKYQPIDCSFHDVLLDRITRKKEVHIVYNVANKGQIRNERVLLEDVFTRQKEEFLKMADGEIIRLDHIVSVDGIHLIKGAACRY